MAKSTKKKVVVQAKAKKDDRSGIFIPAGIFLGMGIGFLLSNLVAWLFIGLGVGFLAMALAKLKEK
ncbi:MAG: hypothetical protein H6502_00320 [Candidatus Woesearchaeota archaeon]|nr:MAG: hypothetical protein H6502_00320 [Candidatus Woesearchaeota archaeon]